MTLACWLAQVHSEITKQALVECNAAASLEQAYQQEENTQVIAQPSVCSNVNQANKGGLRICPHVHRCYQLWKAVSRACSSQARPRQAVRAGGGLYPVHQSRRRPMQNLLRRARWIMSPDTAPLHSPASMGPSESPQDEPALPVWKRGWFEQSALHVRSSRLLRATKCIEPPDVHDFRTTALSVPSCCGASLFKHLNTVFEPGRCKYMGEAPRCSRVALSCCKPRTSTP